MLTLMLLRHAKAELGMATLADKDRSLAQRGRADAPRLGAFVESEGLRPDLVQCSTARRTRETWELAQAAMSKPVETQFEAGIYEASTARLLAIVRRTPASVKRLLLIGHNPGFEDLACDLIRDGEPEAMARIDKKYPTSGLAVLTFSHKQWAQITPRSARLTHFTAPAYLK